MNDFGINIMGFTAVMKPRNFWKKKATDKERTVVVTGGSGCIPEMAYGRWIECRTGPGTHETVSSYDLDYVITAEGKKIHHIEPKEPDCYKAEAPAASVLPPIPDKYLAKRKR